MGYLLLETVRMDTVSATAHWEGVEILDTFYVFSPGQRQIKKNININ